MTTVDYYLKERYLGDRSRSPLLSLYYALKPAIPRALQLRLRRAYARRQAKTTFPRWPIEPLLIERQHDELRARLRSDGSPSVPLTNFWPDGSEFAFILTHDVEGPSGVRNVGRVLEVEQRHGFRSSWNFVAQWYPIEDGLFEHIRARDGEIGLHAIKHDGRLFKSRARFESELPAIHHYLRKWGAVGFRSPATYRNADWMAELGCLYDSSFPDTDPYEPQPGGCCSIFPYFLDDLVELPITLVQDHTLFEILRSGDIAPWTTKSDWVIRNHGLINILTHPDYLDTPPRLRMYEEFLEYLASQRGGWHALPRDVAAWWKTRARLRCEEVDGVTRIVGDGAGRASVAWAREEAGEIVFDVDSPRRTGSPTQLTASR